MTKSTWSCDVMCAVGMARVAAAILLLIATVRMIAGEQVLGVGLLGVVVAMLSVSVVVQQRAQRHPRLRNGVGHRGGLP
jgi:hypothetical protein